MRDFTGSGVWRFLAASSRRARDSRSGHACRVPRRRTFGRGFDSRRLHHTSSINQGCSAVQEAAVPVLFLAAILRRVLTIYRRHQAPADTPPEFRNCKCPIPGGRGKVQRHSGVDVAILAHRRVLYERARGRTPRRWSGKIRNWAPVVTGVLNGEPRLRDLMRRPDERDNYLDAHRSQRRSPDGFNPSGGISDRLGSGVSARYALGS